MPRPIFIICSDGGSQDSETNVLSLFGIIERFEVSAVLKTPEKADGTSDANAHSLVQMMSFRVTAVWMKLPNDDPGQEYQHQFVAYRPDGRESVIADGNGTWFENDDRPLNRFIAKIHGPPFQLAGQYRIESRIRRVGEGDDMWLRQDYPFTVSVSEVSQEEFDKKH